MIDLVASPSHVTAAAVGAVQPGHDAFQKDDRLDASPPAVTPKSPVVAEPIAVVENAETTPIAAAPVAAAVAPVVAPVAAEAAVGEPEKKKVEVKVPGTTASFDPGRQANEVVGAVPAVFGATKGLDPSIPKAPEVEVPRNLEEKKAEEAANVGV